MKKAQTEIIGLVVIVILIIFALVIYMKFSSQTKPETNIKQNILVHNTLNAILKTNPVCAQKTLSKSLYRVISDCTTSDQSPCPTSTSCTDYVEKQLKSALEATLSQKTQYKLVIDYPEDENIVIKTQNFEKCQNIIADNYPISNFIAKLNICS